MKRFALLLIFLSTAAQAQYKYLSSFNSDGVPANVLYETVSDRMRANIKASLPEYYPVPKYHPEYIANGNDTDIKLYEDAEVWVTFVDEGAGYRNVLGFYTYSLDKGPSKPNKSGITIVFPNLSLPGSGGNLKSGSKMYLGKFPAGTGIGWVLVADGYRSNEVGDGNWTLFSTPSFNPEKDPALQFHNVLLKDEIEQKIIMGFEDIRRDNASCDNDFNDALFYVTSNPIKAIMSSNVTTVTESSETITTGNDGGLESNGTLASQIAQRHFQRQVTPSVNYDVPTETRLYSQNRARQARVAGVDLSQFIPENPFSESTKSYTSTPTDLVTITNAKDVLSVDYFADKQRLAAVLSTYTENEVYNHTKTICDRLNGGAIMDIQKVTVRDNQFIMSQIKHADQTIEYAICFSVANQNGQFVVERHWAIDDFPKGKNYFNFQVWGQAPHLAQALAEKVLERLETLQPLQFNSNTVQTPSVFVRQGYYQKGALYLELSNRTQATQLSINGSTSRTETASSKEKWSWNSSLTGEKVQLIKVPVNQLFDSGLAVSNNKEVTTDVLYLADSPWGIDVAQNSANVERFEVTTNQTLAFENAQLLERNAYVKGNVTKNLSLFKLLKPSAKEADMSAFEGVQFEASGKGIVEVILMKKSITTADEQFRVEIKLTEQSQTFSIPFSEFWSTKHKNFKADDLTSVVFSFTGNTVSSKSFEIQVKDLQFAKTLTKSAETIPALEVVLFPNPCAEVANVRFEATESGSSELNLLDAQGRLISQTTGTAQVGKNTVAISTTDLMPGLYFVQVKLQNQVGVKKLIVNK
ncbi:MAG: DUF4114 domain-containing protein [Spirosomataceae bacterium]